jgi:hypothetical protein
MLLIKWQAVPATFVAGREALLTMLAGVLVRRDVKNNRPYRKRIVKAEE